MNRIHWATLGAIMTALLVEAVSAQAYERRQCTWGSNRDTKAFFSGKGDFFSAGVRDRDNPLLPMISAHYATSIRRPDTAAPINPGCNACGLGEKDDPDVKYDRWTCRYSPAMATDGDLSTAWVEGVDGPGIGEILIADVDPKRLIRIRPGMATTDRLFKENNRPKEIRIHTMMSTTRSATQIGVIMGGFKIIAFSTVTLKDRNAWQTFTAPWPKNDDFSAAEDATFLVAIEIVSVYRGSQHDDTGITEISN